MSSPEKSRISWTAEKYHKLFAACLAAHPEFKPNCNKVAKYFGEGATYDAIETRFRPIKQQAKLIRQAVDSGESTFKLPPLQTTAKSRGVAPARTKRKLHDGEDDEEIAEGKSVKKRAQSTSKGTQRLQKLHNTMTDKAITPSPSIHKQNDDDVIQSLSDNDDDTLDHDSRREDIRAHNSSVYPTPLKTPTLHSSKHARRISSFSEDGQRYTKTLSTTPSDLAKPHHSIGYQTPEIIDLASSDEETNMLLATTPSKKPRHDGSIKVKNEQEQMRRKLAILEAQDDDSLDFDP